MSFSSGLLKAIADKRTDANASRVKRLRRVSLAALVPLVLAGVPWNSSAALVPTGSCYDFKYFDGLESRPSAYYCANGLDATGYNGQSYSNVSAKQALARLPLDGVFHFAGHAIVAGSPGAAISLLFQFPNIGGMDALAGAPMGLSVQGPVTLCNESGSSCKSATVVTYPWANLLAKHNLVVLESCNTGGSNLLWSTVSMGNIARYSGAGTVIAFKDLIAFPLSQADAYGIRWSRVFWQNLQNGATYAAASASAASAVGGNGYFSYQVLTNVLAPTTLRPASYYPRVGNGPAAASLATSDARWRHVEQWLGAPVRQATRWVTVERLGGPRWQAQAKGVGLVEIDARTNEVEDAVFDSELSSSQSTLTVSRTGALGNAARFAREHYAGFTGLALREARYLDHDFYREYRFVWQARAGKAWLPSKVAVGVNAATGRVATYSAEHAAPRIATTPEVSRSQPRASALKVTGLAGRARTSEPVLEVVSNTRGGQRLVWITEVTEVPTQPTYVPRYLVVWTDARTGLSEVMARS